MLWGFWPSRAALRRENWGKMVTVFGYRYNRTLVPLGLGRCLKLVLVSWQAFGGLGACWVVNPSRNSHDVAATEGQCLIIQGRPHTDSPFVKAQAFLRAALLGKGLLKWLPLGPQERGTCPHRSGAAVTLNVTFFLSLCLILVLTLLQPLGWVSNPEQSSWISRCHVVTWFKVSRKQAARPPSATGGGGTGKRTQWQPFQRSKESLKVGDGLRATEQVLVPALVSASRRTYLAFAPERRRHLLTFSWPLEPLISPIQKAFCVSILITYIWLVTVNTYK